MSLNELLKEQEKKEREKRGEIEITRERVEKNLPAFRKLIAYWRMYPDRMIDYYCSLDPDCHFHFYAYQRLFLRCALRYKNVYATFVRAWSKSFMSDMALMCKAILYPGAKLFTVSGVKQRQRLLGSTAM